jgi:phosphate transport system substrate-binding protein
MWFFYLFPPHPTLSLWRGLKSRAVYKNYNDVMKRINFSLKTTHICRSLMFAIFVALIACTPQDSVMVAGSTTVLPVISKAAEQFSQATGISVIVNAGGSGVGINQLAGGKIAIGMISRNITEKEKALYPDVAFITHSIGKDAVVPVVSSEIYNAGITSLTLQQIGQIYLGKIGNWKQLGGPDKDILVVDKEASRGTRHVFMQAILGDKEALAPGADLVLGANNEEQTAITQSDAAIGMLSHAWLNSEVKGLAINLTNGQRIEPNLQTITNGLFPITRDLLLVTNGTPTGHSKKFIDYILSTQGQKIVTESGYVSLHQ